ncbi:MAG TPA: molybdate ABC transporter substrate-binding protein [Thermoanaerobaculia bacterium]|nr:molybdate ABC transporter substrate-binding protein [Thermoanaerobaculia bacterium]
MISLLLLVLGLGLGLAAPADVVEVNVLAAASLTEALREIAAAYEKAGGDRIVLNLGASSNLTRQIQEGAPADVFFSADEAKMDWLEERGQVLEGSRKSLLSNTLVIVVPADSPLKIRSARDLADPKVRYLALADPQGVPAGVYARELLQSQGVWNALTDKLIPTENVRGALAAVESGNVEVGIVYRTDARTSKKVKIAYEVPASEGPKISYPVAVLAKSRQQAEALKFLSYLKSPAALAVFRNHGFIVPSR